MRSNEQIQKKRDEERGKADLRERYRSYDFTPVPEHQQPRLMPHPQFWKNEEERLALIEEDERQANLRIGREIAQEMGLRPHL